MLIKANYYSLSPRRFIAGTKNSYGVETVSFEFSSEWDGLIKTVTFYPVGGKPVAVIYDDAPIYIPAEVMARPGMAQFTLSGTKNSRSLISITGYIDILDTKEPGGETPLEPTPSEMAQVLDMMNTAVATAKSVREDADKGLFNGEKGESGTIDISNIDEVAEKVAEQLEGANDILKTSASTYIHFWSGNDAYFECDTVNGKVFMKFGGLGIRGRNDGDHTLAAVAAACGTSLVRSTKGVEGCLCVENEYVLSYSLNDNKIIYGHREDTSLQGEDHVVILAQNGGRIVQCIPNILYHLHERLENKDTVIPSYWSSDVASAIDKITEYQNEAGLNGFAFGFITDTHRNYFLDGSFVNIMKRVLDECDIPVVIHGGDFVGGAENTPKSNLILDIKHHKEIFKPIKEKLLQALGNHDSTFGVNSQYDGGLTDSEIYNYIFRANEERYNAVKGATGRYFYIDNPLQKVRYIILDSHDVNTSVGSDGVVASNAKLNNSAFGNDQINWLANALYVENGYSIVICSHVPPYRESDKDNIGWTVENSAVDADVILGVVNAYRNKSAYSFSSVLNDRSYNVNVNFINAKGSIVCWVSGHTHKDHIFDLDGLKAVSTANCSLHQSVNPIGYAPSKTKGTATEFAFDFFCVNTLTRSCNIVRLGACLDNASVRSFEYSNDSGDAETLKFYITHPDDTTKEYQYEEGMTWNEWVESSYNTGGFYIGSYGSYGPCVFFSHSYDGENILYMLYDGSEIPADNEIYYDEYSSYMYDPITIYD